MEIKRKYNSEFRKKLVTKLDNIKDKSDLLIIYNIIVEDIGTNYSSNRNGIFINMNILSNKCIERLIEFSNNKNNNDKIINNDKSNYNSYNVDDIEIISEIGPKLSNQEKNIIKRFKNKFI